METGTEPDSYQTLLGQWYKVLYVFVMKIVDIISEVLG